MSEGNGGTSGNGRVHGDGSVKVAINDLSFYYGNFKALKNITLPLYRNKVTAFIGPSGCGKSTLLRVLNRIYEMYPGQHAEGEVLLDGQNILDPGVDVTLLRAKAIPNGMLGYLIAKVVCISGQIAFVVAITLLVGAFTFTGLAIGRPGSWLTPAGSV